jgi:hypothetical protein
VIAALRRSRSRTAECVYLAADAPLPEPATAAARPVRVLLATDHARLALLPWSPALLRPSHWQTYAASRLEQLHGAPTQPWTVRVIDEPPPRPRLAVALPTALLEALGVVPAPHAQTVGRPRPAQVRLELTDRLSELVAQRRRASGVLVELNRIFATVATLRDGVLVGMRRRRIDRAGGAAADAEAVAATVAAERAGAALDEAPVWVAARQVGDATAAAAALRSAGLPAELAPC